MHNRLLLGKYYPGNSILHRLDPRTKFILLIILMITILIPRTAFPLVLIAVFSIILILISKIPVKEILKSLRSVSFIIIFAFIINIFSGEGNTLFKFYFLEITDASLKNAIIMSARLIFLVLDTTILLTLTTTSLQLADGIESLLKPLTVFRVPAHEIAMMISIALRFVPTLMEETQKIIKAQSSRGANFDAGGFYTKIRGYVSIIVPLFVSSFRRASELALAMEARCYRGGEGRTKLKELKYERLDLIFTIGFLLACSIILFSHYKFTNLL
ncbi:MAG: energy-coupling factor transporter transmembrane protein EcfT [Clostridiaceae bacterium]|nr:energy-coupling factor transporter transmembrane protein EcfT [Clostridiaceae bacterium]